MAGNSTNIDTLDFKLILDDTQFNKQIDADMKAAEKLNAALSDFLTIKSKVGNVSINIDTKSSIDNLSQLSGYLQQLMQADWSSIGSDLNVASYVNNAITEMHNLIAEIEKVKQLRMDMSSVDELTISFQNASRQALALSANLKEIKKAQNMLKQGFGNMGAMADIEKLSKSYLKIAKNLDSEVKAIAKWQKAKEKELSLRKAVTAAVRDEIEAKAGNSTQIYSREYLSNLREASKELSQMAKTHYQIQKQKPFEEHNKSLLQQNRLLREASSLAASYFSILGAKRVITDLVRISSEFEYQRTTLAAILNDIAGADKIFSQIKGLAIKSPFSFKELVTYSKQLSAFAVPMKELYDTTKMLADVSSGLGVGMDRLVLAYGQVRSAEFLRGQEVRQFTEAGIPILEELRKQFEALGEEGITTADVFDKISQRLVPFSMVEQMFKNMTSEGGKFYNMQEIQADTLKGKISNLRDAYEIMLNQMGERQSGILKGSVDAVRLLMQNYEKVGVAITSLAVAYGVYKATIIATKVAEEALLIAGANRVNIIKGVTKAIKILTTESKAYLAINKMIASVNWFALATAAVVAVGSAFAGTAIEASKFYAELKKIAAVEFQKVEAEIAKYDKLIAKLRESNDGTQERRDLISQINNLYGDYLPQLLNEANALQVIAENNDRVRQSMLAKAKALAETKVYEKIDDRYTEDTASALNKIMKSFDAAGIGKDSANNFIKGFNQALKEDDQKYSVSVFKEKLESYYGRDKAREIYNTFEATFSGVRSYADAVRGFDRDLRNYTDAIDAIFANKTTYSSKTEEDIYTKVANDMEQKFRDLYAKQKTLSKEEYDDELNKLNLARLYALREEFTKLNTAVETNLETGEQVSKAIGTWDNVLKRIDQEIEGLSPKSATWLQTVVNPLVTGKGNNDLKAKDVTKYFEYVEEIRKAYKEASAQYETAGQTYKGFTADKKAGLAVDDAVLAKSKAQYEQLKKRKEIIEAIGNALHISIDDKVKKGTGKSQEQIQIEERISLLKKLQSAYEKLTGVIDDADMTSALTNLFSDSKVEGKEGMIMALNFREQLVQAANELMRFDEKAGMEILNYLGADKTSEEISRLKELAKARKAVADANNNFEKYMKSWIPSEGLEGTGAIYKISKIVSDYRKELEQINNKRDEAVAKLNEETKARENLMRLDGKNAGKSQEEIDSIIKEAYAYGELNDKEKLNVILSKTLTAQTASLTTATAKAQGTIKDFIEAWAGQQGLNLDNWSQKSLIELNVIKRTLKQAKLDDIIPDEVKEQFNELDINVDSLTASLEEYMQQIDKVASKRLREGLLSNINQVISGITKLSGQLSELGEVTGNLALSSVANALSTMLPMLSEMSQQVASGNYIGAAITMVTTLVGKILEAVTAEEKLKAAIADARREQYLLNLESGIESGTSNMWGEDHHKKFTQAYAEYHKTLEKAQADLEKAQEKLWGGRSNNSNGAGTAIGAGAGAALGAAVGAIMFAWSGPFAAIFAAIGAAFGAIAGAITGAVSGAAYDAAMIMDDYHKSLAEMADEIGAELIDSNTGLFNKATLEKILEVYSDLDKESVDYIKDIITNLEAMELVIEDVADYFTEVFGDITTQIADNFVEAFKASGEAALDFSDIMDDVATNIAKSITKSLLMETIFDDDKAKKAAEYLATGQTNKALEVVYKAMQDAETMAPALQNLYESLTPYLKVTPESTSSMSEGIQSITEKTADLLASYINAMRSDLSYMKGLDEVRNNNLSQILALMPDAPSLMEYMASIQANTYDTARYTQELLSSLRSVITSEAGQPSIRTYM